MEYLSGETLEDRLKRGALPLEQALQVAIQIADALAAAHRAGVIHRDLKPGNIMLTGGGRAGPPQAKLLDFGLAKSGPPVATTAAGSMLPTLSPALTAQGTILGTFQYMAPEQIEGLEADARTDIFAFGAVLYEMVTGRRAFDAKSRASLIAAILEHEPPESVGGRRRGAAAVGARGAPVPGQEPRRALADRGGPAPRVEVGGRIDRARTRPSRVAERTRRRCGAARSRPASPSQPRCSRARSSEPSRGGRLAKRPRPSPASSD